MKTLYLLLGLSLTHLASAASVQVQPVYGSFGPTTLLESVSLSRDGSTVVGIERASFNTPRFAFQWRPLTGAEQALPITAFEGRTLSTSANGEVLVGGISSGSPSFTTAPFVWSEANGVRQLANRGPGLLLTPYDTATDVSPDGSVVVTRSNEVGYFTWSESDGYNAIGLHEVNDISNGGEYIVGINSLGQGVVLSSTGPTIIDSAPVVPLAITPDGAWVAGTLRQTGPIRDSLFLWSTATGYQDIGLIGGYNSGSFSQMHIANDGKTILGQRTPDVPTASNDFIWTEDQGIQEFSEMMLSNYGFDVTPYGGAISMSGDARTFLLRSSAGYHLLTIVPEPSCLLISAIASTALLSSRHGRRDWQSCGKSVAR